MIIKECNEYTSENNIEEQINTEKLKKYMEQLDEFDLGDESKANIVRYLNYIFFNKDDCEKTLPFNFMIHCDDQQRALNFVDKFVRIIDKIKNKESKVNKFTEAYLFSNSKDIDTMICGDATVLCGCYGYHEYNAGGDSVKNSRNNVWKSYLECIKRKPSIVNFICAPSRVLKERFKINEHMYYRIFRLHIYIDNMDVKEIIDLFHSKIKEIKYVEEEEFIKEIDEYIKTIYDKAQLKNRAFIDDLLERVLMVYYEKPNEDRKLNVKCVPYYHKMRSYEEVAYELEGLVGLESVKNEIKKIEKLMKYNKRIEGTSVMPFATNMNMVFMGNPGTGKTTIAKIIADIFNGLGALKTNKVVVAERKDLVGEYIGHTAPKTAALIEKAIDGVLFIDEAYSLTPKDSPRDTGAEAINTLLTAMNDYVGRLVVIFAGYSNDMEDFMNFNPGLRSRIGYKFTFQDYSVNELQEILYRKMNQNGYTVSEDAKIKIRDIMEHYSNKENFGNGRFVDQVFQRIILQHAENEPSDENLAKICVDDIPSIEEFMEIYK